VLSNFDWIDAQLLGYHEAAHAVVAVELGWDLYWTTIEPSTDGFAATFAALETSTTTRPPDTMDFRRAVERDCLFLLAGWATERVIMPARRTLEHFGADDFERASSVLGLLPISKSARRESLQYLNEQTMSFVARPEVFIRIRHVTDALLKKRTLSGGDVLRAIATADLQHGTVGRRPLLAARPIVRPGCPILRPVSCRVGLGRFPLIAERVPAGRVPLVAERIPVPVSTPRTEISPALAFDEPRPPRNESERSQQFANAFAPLRLSSRALGAMRRGEITSLRDLLGWTESELVTIRAVGKGIAREIVAAVHEAGYALWPDDAQYRGKEDP
jgi:hypothetical protein